MQNMKTSRIIWGLIFIFCGTIVLLENFDIIKFEWLAIWKYWPIILILSGANMLLERSRAAGAGILIILLTLSALGFITWKGMVAEPDYAHSWIFKNRKHAEKPHKTIIFSETSAGERLAQLNISGGGTKYTLKDTAAELLRASVRASTQSYSLKKLLLDSLTVLNLKMSDNKDIELNDGTYNTIDLFMSRKPVWDVKIEAGASSANFNLQDYKVRNFKYESGASKLYLKLGSPLENSKVTIDAGVSKIVVELPRTAACSIKAESGLSSLEVEGIKKMADNFYQTDNFATSRERYIIQLTGGLTAFEIKQY